MIRAPNSFPEFSHYFLRRPRLTRWCATKCFSQSLIGNYFHEVDTILRVYVASRFYSSMYAVGSPTYPSIEPDTSASVGKFVS
jgi:hypothetical protein